MVTFLVLLAIVIVVSAVVRQIGQVKPLLEVDGSAKSVVLLPFETENPYLLRAFTMPAYGRVPANIADLVGRLTPDGDEKVLATVFVTRANYRAGYLVATTSRLYWVGTRPFRSVDCYEWGTLERERFTYHSPIIRCLSPGICACGDIYYVRGFQKGREFIKLLDVLVHAMEWQGEYESQLTQQALLERSVPSVSVADELERLIVMQQAGSLTDEEYEAAKRQLLG